MSKRRGWRVYSIQRGFFAAGGAVATAGRSTDRPRDVARQSGEYFQMLGKDGAADSYQHDAARHLCTLAHDVTHDAAEHHTDGDHHHGGEADRCCGRID